MSQHTKKPVVVLAVLAILGTAIAVTTATATSKNHAVKLHTSTPHAISVRLGRVFHVLSDAHSATVDGAAQPLPAGVVDAMSTSQPSLAPAAAVFAGGTFPTWVVPGSGEVCLVVGSTGPNSVPSSPEPKMASR
jgi:hypothetical protein